MLDSNTQHWQGAVKGTTGEQISLSWKTVISLFQIENNDNSCAVIECFKENNWELKNKFSDNLHMELDQKRNVK